MTSIGSFERFGSHAGRVTCALAELATVFCQTFKYPPERLLEIEQMIKEERRKGHIYLVWLVLERIAGFVSYRFDTRCGDVVVELNHIGCLNTTGVAGGGRALIRAMERDIGIRIAQTPGARLHCIYLRAHAANILAQNLYRRCGFWPVAMMPGLFHRGVDEIIFQKLYPGSPAEQERLVQLSRCFEEQLAAFGNRGACI